MLLSQLRPEAASAVAAMDAAIRVIGARTDADTVVGKSGSDFATGTDIRSQSAIREILSARHPGHAFVGEESGADTIPSEGSYWLVDPICGTRNFAFGIPLYSVNIALIEGGEVTIGAVGDGANGTIWLAQAGRGAWRVAGAALEPIATNARSNMIVIDPGKPGGPGAQLAASVLAAAVRLTSRELRVIGAALDLAFLAEGRIAAVWHFSRSSPLHFAAGVLLAREAGAVVTDERAETWRPGSEGLVAAATASLHAELLGLSAS